jgi:hypothetical protein
VLLKPGAQNVLVLWAGTNDLATGAGTAQTAYANLLSMAHIAHAAGWQVVEVDIIARGDYFTTPQLQMAFPANQAALNALILNSAEFDAVADPAAILTGHPTVLVVWDSSPGSTHPASIGALANLAGRENREYDEGTAGRHKRTMNKQGTIQGIRTSSKRLRKPSAPLSSSCRNWNLKAPRRHPEASSSSRRSDRLELRKGPRLS